MGHTRFFHTSRRHQFVRGSGATSATFVYDGDGNRVKATVGSTTTAYLGNYFEWTGSTSTMKKYYYAGSTRVAVMSGATLSYLLGDHLGSTAYTINTGAIKTGELRYKAWGETRFNSGTTPTSMRFTGQRQESTLGGMDGLYFYGSRWHDPYLNRWIQPDTIIPQNQGVQGWDRYAYANNNPVRYTDPTGHCVGPLLLVCIGVALIGAGASVAAINTGVEQVGWASSQTETIAQEKAAAQQCEANCMGQCHYAASVSATPGVTVGGSRPETPVSDSLVEGYYNITQGTVGLLGNVARLAGIGLSATQQTTTGSTVASQNLDDLANDISDWVSNGEVARGFRNSDGDFLLINSSNTRQFRFDYFDPSPHQNPHMHLLEWVENRKWEGPRIFPSDVEPR